MTVRIGPDRHRAIIFDLDGVITDTASVHFDAWREVFDEFLADRPAGPGEEHRPFDRADYLHHVDGRPRYDGVEGFLRSRGIVLERGLPTDPPDRPTVCGLGNRKNGAFLERLQRQGVRMFDDGVALVRRAQARGLGTAIISASRNCQQVLHAAGIGDLFAVRVDGAVADALGLPGKPDPAVFDEAARRLGVPPAAAVIVEDSEAGATAGRAGGYGLVIGVARSGQREGLLAAGADTVVADLDEVRFDEPAAAEQQGGGS